MEDRIMSARTLTTALSVGLAVLIAAAGCAKKEPPAPAQSAAPPEAAAPATPAPPAESTPAAAPAAVAATAATSDGAGAQPYKMFCETCHGATGMGDGLAAASLNPKPANFAIGAFKYDANGNGTKGDLEDIKAIVRDGAAKHGGSPLMAAWPMLSPEQLQAVAEYVKAFHTG